ncbi:MAG: LysR family transcriptional regulator [Cellvibrionales bacterium]|nr:LysR family transcriptional regulator [Cellvibrionales bacterium]
MVNGSTSQDRPRFSLRQLEIVLGVVSEGSTAAAAEKLHLSQSAVSAALKTLEDTYGERYPEARVDIVPGNSPDIVNKVIEQQVDIGLIEEEVSHPMLTLTPWLEDELVVFCSPDHPLAPRGALTEKDLLRERWILREEGSGARQRFDQTFSTLLPKLELFLEFRHNEPIRRAVEQGMGIGCLSEKVLASHFENGALVPLRLPPVYRMQRRFFICTRRKDFERAAVASFTDLCLAS